MPKIFVPTQGVEDWRRRLAAPDKHWKVGFSAEALARSWQATTDFPQEVRRVLEASGLRQFRGLEMLIGIPERQVNLPPAGGHPSQNDLWVLARGPEGLVSITVEGKVAESFGPRLGEWRRDASTGKTGRLEFIQQKLGLAKVPDEIRYQLLHRLASAVLEAERFTARHALMLVHSFSKAEDGLEDFRKFARLFGVEVDKGEIVKLSDSGNIRLSLGWVADQSTQPLAAT